jgi:hypothetical protein
MIRFLSRIIEHIRLGELELSGGELSAPPETLRIEDIEQRTDEYASQHLIGDETVADITRLLLAVRTVLELHTRIPGMFTSEDYCAHDHQEFPCATVRAIS